MRADFIYTNGIRFKFNNIKNRSKKEIWMSNIVNEVIILVQQLKLAQEKGSSIHWDSLVLMNLPLTDNAQKIIINKQMDFIKSPLPLLVANKDLFNQFIPWIKSNVEEKNNFRIIIKQADTYFLNKPRSLH